MDQLPLCVTVLYSIPESFLVCWLGLSLVNERRCLWRLGLVAVLAAFFSFIARGLSLPYGFHSLFHLAFLVLAVTLLLQTSFWNSLLAVLFGFMFLALVETINVPLFCWVVGLDLENILRHPWLRVGLGFPQLLILGLMVWAVNRFDLRLINRKPVGKDMVQATEWEHRRTFLFYSLVAILALQVILVTFIRCREYLIRVFPLLPACVFEDAIILLLVLVVFISLKIVLRLLRLTEELAQYQCEVESLRNVGELFASMRAQRHDFLNHVQTLYGMLQLRCFQDAQDYIREVFQETVALNNVVVTGNPSLAALFHVKAGAAAARGIEFQVSVECEVGGLQIPSHELSRILGNLIDNAFDAAEMEEPSRRKVSMSVRKEQESLVFDIENCGFLDPKVKELIFYRGFSTKKGEHMGMGLSIVQELLQKYGGTVTIDDTGHGSVLSQVSIPYSR